MAVAATRMTPGSGGPGRERRARVHGRALPSPARGRLFVPEGGVGRPRPAAADRPRRPRLHAGYPRPLPRDLRDVEARRGAVRHHDRGPPGAEPRPPGRHPRRPPVGARPGRVLPPAQGRPAAARRSPTSTPGSRACAASSRRCAPARPSWPGTPSTSAGRPTRSPTGPSADVWRHIVEHDVPYNPLHDRGYASIGCTHCTKPGDGRDGRWAGSDKTECGLHG